MHPQGVVLRFPSRLDLLQQRRGRLLRGLSVLGLHNRPSLNMFLGPIQALLTVSAAGVGAGPRGRSSRHNGVDDDDRVVTLGLRDGGGEGSLLLSAARATAGRTRYRNNPSFVFCDDTPKTWALFRARAMSATEGNGDGPSGPSACR